MWQGKEVQARHRHTRRFQRVVKDLQRHRAHRHGIAGGIVSHRWRSRPGPLISASVIVSPGAMIRDGDPFRPSAAMPPRPRSPPGFSKLMERLSSAVAICARIVKHVHQAFLRCDAASAARPTQSHARLELTAGSGGAAMPGRGFAWASGAGAREHDRQQRAQPGDPEEQRPSLDHRHLCRLGAVLPLRGLADKVRVVRAARPLYTATCGYGHSGRVRSTLPSLMRDAVI